MTYIDSALLDFVERLCHRFQILTGRTNLWLAFQLTNLSIVVYFVWAGVYLWNSHGLRRVALLLFCIGLLYLLAVTVFRVPVETQESGAYRRVSRGFRNPRRVRDAPLRIAFLTLSVVLFSPTILIYANLQRFSAFMPPWVAMSAFLSYSLIVLTAVVLYLLACDPLPPCAGRVTEWIRNLFASRVPASAPERQGRIIGGGGRSGIRQHRSSREAASQTIEPLRLRLARSPFCLPALRAGGDVLTERLDSRSRNSGRSSRPARSAGTAMPGVIRTGRPHRVRMSR